MDVETDRQRKRILWTGVICVVVGVVFTGQGAGLISGSSMTGKPLWLIIGIATTLCGLGASLGSLRASKRR